MEISKVWAIQRLRKAVRSRNTAKDPDKLASEIYRELAVIGV